MSTPQPLTMQAAAKYRFLGKLGEGGMAEVYVGVMDQAPGFRKLLVLKLLRTSLAEDRDGLAMFLDEARLAARLNHRNVVQTYEVGQIGDRYAIVMEFLEGAPLSKLRRAAQTTGEKRGLPLAESLHVVCEALGGLHYAHELKDFDGAPLHFVHRDFTPANVMVTLDGQVKVLDFGVAKTRANVAHTRTGTLKGTTRYMAREAVLGLPTDRRTDVYMAGAVLWQLVTGARPWDDKADVAVLVAILESRLPPVRMLDPTLSPELEDIILRATDPDPDARPQSAHDLRDEVLDFARRHGLSSDPDRIAALVQELAGADCALLRRRIDSQLSEPPKGPPEVTLAASLPAPSQPGVEASASRIRPTSIGERTRWRLRRIPLLFAGCGFLALAAGLFAAITYAPEPVRHPATDIRLTVALPRPAAENRAAAAPPALMRELPLPAQAPEPSGTMVALRVSAEPRLADLFLDGDRLPGNPATLSVKRDDGLHELRAEAPGYLPKLVQLRFDQDADLTLELRPERTTKKRSARRERSELRAARRAADAASNAAVPERKPEPSGPPARRIDTDSPFR